MKNISKILFIAAMAIAAAACNREEDNLFDKSSAARVSEAIENCQNILTAPENGWIMSYFPHSSQNYGGYTFILKFNTDGTVIATGEIAEPGTKATSLYQINQSAGVTLCFDTYNEVISAFSDPDPKIYGSQGSGMGGDNDFLIVSAGADKVVLKGKKSGSYSTLVPMTSSDWDGYLQAIGEASEEMAFSAYTLKKGDINIPVKASYRKMTFSYTDEEGNNAEQSAAYIQTATGFKMYEPIEIMGINIDEFVYDAKTESFSVAGDNGAVLSGVVPPLGEVLLDGWVITYNNLGPWAKAQFDSVDKTLKAKENEALTYALLCSGSDLVSSYTSEFGFCFVSGGQYAGHIGITATPIGNDQVSMAWSGTTQGNGSYYLSADNFGGYMEVFGYKTARTFNITTDSKKSPGWLKLTEVSNPDNWFILIPDFVTYK